MKLSDLLRAAVVTEAGDALGHVHDVRFTSATGGPEGWSALGLIVGPSAFGTRLGYGRGGEHGPWVVAAVMGLLLRRGRVIPWDRVTRIDLENRRVVVSGSRDDFPPSLGSRDAGPLAR